MDCPSCYEYFDADDRIPRNLNCGHTFCEQCLIKIDQQRLTVCPICRATIQKPFKPKKLPKNFIALDYAQRQQEMLKKSNFCEYHPKELMKHFCNTCMKLICVDCIVDHSGHSFVRKEESVYVLKENGQQIIRQLEKFSTKTEMYITNGVELFKTMKLRRIKDLKGIDLKYQSLIDRIETQKAQVKLRYNECFKIEEQRINQELESFEKHMSLINFNKETVQNTVTELDGGSTDKITRGSEISTKIDNFKKIQEELESQTTKLQEIQVSFPQVQVSMDGFDVISKEVENLVSINHNRYLMSDKNIAFFGDTNKVMLLDLKKNEWTIKTISSPSQRNASGPSGTQNLDFMYYAAAVTLPNGDALITGGGSSTTVYQFINAKCEIVMKQNMNQMRKEHAAVINGPYVYVMGGYDGVQNIFLNSCEIYNISKNEWKFFAPMNISKCAFSATVVNKEYVYTFGGYDGQQRLDAIERYHIKDGTWELLTIKLKFPLSNCACFCPQKNKVIVFGGGFSSGFSPFVEQIDVVTEQWESLPIMSEGRDLRNKVCFVEGAAYAMGGLHSKAEKLVYGEKKWLEVPSYPLSDNLDSWASCLLFTPKLFSNKQGLSNSEGLHLLGSSTTDTDRAQEQTTQEESKKQGPSSARGASNNLKKLSLEQLKEKEKELDDEINQEVDKSQLTEEFMNTFKIMDSQLLDVQSDPFSSTNHNQSQLMAMLNATVDPTSSAMGNLENLARAAEPGEGGEWNQNSDSQGPGVGLSGRDDYLYYDGGYASSSIGVSEDLRGANMSSSLNRRFFADQQIPGSMGTNQRAGGQSLGRRQNGVNDQGPSNQRSSNLRRHTGNYASGPGQISMNNANRQRLAQMGTSNASGSSTQGNQGYSGLGQMVSPSRGGNIVNLGENFEDRMAMEESNEETGRDTAHAIEELQRAQADNLTDDEFEENSTNNQEIGHPANQPAAARQDAGEGRTQTDATRYRQVPAPSSGGSGTTSYLRIQNRTNPQLYNQGGSDSSRVGVLSPNNVAFAAGRASQAVSQQRANNPQMSSNQGGDASQASASRASQSNTQQSYPRRD